MRLLYQHPTTVSGVSVDGSSIATSCFDGFVRLFNLEGQVILAEQRASQLNAVALRGGVIASDDDLNTAKTGVAITLAGQIIMESDFGVGNIAAIDKTGQFAVAHNPSTLEIRCHDRLSGNSWVCVPAALGHDKWAMGVELLDSQHIVIVSLDGYVRVWNVASQAVVRERLLAANGFNGVDTNADGSRIVVTHWGETTGSNPVAGIMVLDAALNPLIKAVENGNFIHQARFLTSGQVVYGTADGRLCQWDGLSQIYVTPVPVPPTPKPPKGKSHKK